LSEQYAALERAIREGNVQEAAAEAQALAEAGTSPLVIFSECIEPVLADIGDQFSRLEIFLPEMMESAEAVKGIQAILQPYLEADGSQRTSRGKVVICTISGDLHDIGKNLVCMMAEGAGFEVHDIGVDQSLDKFLAAAEKCKPNIVGMSALLTTTMTYMKTVVDGFKEKGLGDVKMAIGGAPVSQMFADEIGADGYGADASNAVDMFLELVEKK